MEGKGKTKQCLPWKVFCRYAAWYIHSTYLVFYGMLVASQLFGWTILFKKRSLASKWAQSCETESLISSDFLLCNGPIHMVFLGIRQKSNELAQYIKLYNKVLKIFEVCHASQTKTLQHCLFTCSFNNLFRKTNWHGHWFWHFMILVLVSTCNS